MLTIKPISLKDANRFVIEHHRHHGKATGHKFSIAAYNADELVGVAIVGRPLARYLDNGETLEVLRLCTIGQHNACSILYGRCARIAKEMGYRKIITYILESEMGTSLKASGWVCEKEDAGGGSWSAPSRPRELVELTLFGDDKPKYPIEKKKRYCKVF